MFAISAHQDVTALYVKRTNTEPLPADYFAPHRPPDPSQMHSTTIWPVTQAVQLVACPFHPDEMLSPAQGAQTVPAPPGENGY